jgi:hypothetical protein
MVVIDDRTKNLMAFLAEFPEARAIWVQFGAHAEKAVGKLEQGNDPAVAEAIAQGRIIPVSSIDQVVGAIEQMYESGVLNRDKELAAAFDFDDTIIDNEKRRELQHDAVVKVLNERGWV